MKANYLKEIK